MSIPAGAEEEFERRYDMTVDEAYDLLYPFARYLTAHDRIEARELLGEFFAQHLLRLTGSEPVRHPPAFLRASLVHCRLDVLRKEVRRRAREFPIPVLPETSNSAALPYTPPSVLGEWMTSVVGRDDADLLWRHFVDGETQTALAAEAGTPPATMSDRVQRALRLLREDMEGEES